jgi:hypothetical protein
MSSCLFIVLAMPSDDGQKWPKHVKAEIVLAPIKLIALDGLLLLIYASILRRVTVLGVPYRECMTRHSFALSVSVLGINANNLKVIKNKLAVYLSTVYFNKTPREEQASSGISI